jgi:hypothetical protein
MLTRWSRAFALSCWCQLAAGCDTGFVSIGRDRPPSAEALPCAEVDCGEFPAEPAMCSPGDMGTYECQHGEPSGACGWKPVCMPVGCSPIDCGDQPPPHMCVGQMLLEYECRFDTSDGCAWRQPTCPT